MGKENSIVLISANEDFAAKLAERIILLRKTDKVITCGYVNALKTVMENETSVAILHDDGHDKTISMAGELQSYSPVILLSQDDQTILDAYDRGITDFCRTDAKDFELVMRIVNCLKTAINKQAIKRANKILIQNQILDKDTGFYTYKAAETVINNEIMLRDLQTGTFIAVSPAENSKSFFSTDRIAKAIKQSVRADDIVTFGKGAKFYILLPYTNVDGAVAVIEKLESAFSEKFEIKVGISEIAGKDFLQMEKESLKALLDAMYSENTYIVSRYKDEVSDDWLDEDVVKSKNYKLFRQIYNKKLEKVIIPVFYRAQMAYDEKMPDSTIFQFADDEQCIFHIKNKYQDSKLKIIYPGFAKVMVYIIHQGLDSPENRDIALPLSKITHKDLMKIIDDFIAEFKTAAVK